MEGYVSLVDGSRMVKRSVVWLRRLVTLNEVEGRKDENGDWLLSVASLNTYKLEVEAKEQARLRNIEEGYKYPYTRPRVMCVRMMRDEVAELGASDEVVKFIDKVEKKWAKEFEAKYAKNKVVVIK